ncbi:helix-turn-helix transcriptional regulator [bacterium]|nr:helix-turn-helix transcriptional regulator [bacterium]
MKVYEAVAALIQELCEKRIMTFNRLANISGLSPSTVKSIIYGVSKNPGITTIKILCDGLEISLIEFFDSDVFKTLEQEIE